MSEPTIDPKPPTPAAAAPVAKAAPAVKAQAAPAPKIDVETGLKLIANIEQYLKDRIAGLEQAIKDAPTLDIKHPLEFLKKEFEDLFEGRKDPTTSK